MPNPLTAKCWSPYVVGAGVGVLSWFAFATADRPIGVTTAFEHAAALGASAVAPGLERSNVYFAARAREGSPPKVGWEATLVVGVFLGSLLGAWLSGDRTNAAVPPPWHRRFGGNAAVRLVAAFLSGALMMFGARMAQGCTSGHGISGTLQLAVSSWAFILAAFGVAVATAFLVYGKEGREHV
jgi:hypothetical protein